MALPLDNKHSKISVEDRLAKLELEIAGLRDNLANVSSKLDNFLKSQKIDIDEFLANDKS